MDGLHIVVAGAGGNTGSHLLPHLARMSEVARLTLADPDVYESGNLTVQNIELTDVGRTKVEAQAERLMRIRLDLEVVSHPSRIEDIPRGLLRPHLFVSCLDSKAARQHLNEIAWRAGVPWIDCGVLGSQSLVRVSAWVPCSDAPCLECLWNPAKGGDYSVLEQEYLCGNTTGAGFPSMASSALGAIAASLVAIEITKFVRAGHKAIAGSRQMIFDAEHKVVQVTEERRNPWCRFDHRVWDLKPWHRAVQSTTVSEALAQLGSIQVDGHHFVEELVCLGCGRRDNEPKLNRPLRRCTSCNRRMAPTGIGPLERLDSRTAGAFLPRTLAEIGLRFGDILTCGCRHRLLVEAA